MTTSRARSQMRSAPVFSGTGMSLRLVRPLGQPATCAGNFASIVPRLALRGSHARDPAGDDSLTRQRDDPPVQGPWVGNLGHAHGAMADRAQMMTVRGAMLTSESSFP